jgi:drug/metabolite transporter (DMT)-like permease
LIDAFSTPHNRIKTLILLAICGLSAIAAAAVGIDDNPPGILLAFLAATAFVLAFVHPWRTARKFIFLLLASILGFVLFIILNIILDTVAQNPATTGALQDLLQRSASKPNVTM